MATSIVGIIRLPRRRLDAVSSRASAGSADCHGPVRFESTGEHRRCRLARGVGRRAGWLVGPCTAVTSRRLC